ncbi:acyltransferase family protein [Weissella viridescens]|uniref:acyltransferase family protein n=1 Tax=Weissella viridescens TaxID=1629 RepID=UPI0017468EE6|nr:acyltransferase family protein [Weissella viridescens]QOD85856.1 acyltransferase family protein [Weissella viridescens]WJI90974.1 acyltransferase family protein [Weissella viridescens]
MSPSQTKSTTPYVGIDLLKCILAILVVAIHTHAPFFNILGRFAVPFFFMTSSFFFFKKYIHLENRHAQNIALWRYAKKLAIMYVLWRILYLPFDIYKNFQSNPNSFPNISVSGLIKWFFKFVFIGRDGTFITGWYLIASIFGMLVIVFLIRYVGLRVTLIISIIVELLILMVTSYGQVTFSIILINHALPFLNNPFSTLTTNTFIRSLLPFTLGFIIFMLSNSHKSITTNKKLINFYLILFSILYIVECIVLYRFTGVGSFDETLFLQPAVFFLVLYGMASHVSLSTSHSLYLREFSTFIFLVHPMFFQFRMSLDQLVNITGVAADYFNFVWIVLASIATYFAYRWLRKLTGFKWLRYIL